MGTKNKPGAFDCYANAEPDEPMFILLGRDKHAPDKIEMWANERERDGEDPTKVSEARDCAAAMRTFRIEREARKARGDLPTPPTDRPLSPGDTVQLKSGGPVMTIEDVIDGRLATASWFDARGDAQEGEYVVAALRRAAPSAPLASAQGEPDAWQEAAWDLGNLPDTAAVPMGWIAKGSWVLCGFRGTATSAIPVWRRPLRKVSP